jgi:hypothetical protein
MAHLFKWWPGGQTGAPRASKRKKLHSMEGCVCVCVCVACGTA